MLTLIRLLLQEQSGLGLNCLFRSIFAIIHQSCSSASLSKRISKLSNCCHSYKYVVSIVMAIVNNYSAAIAIIMLLP